LGTPVLTTRGMKEKEMEKVGKWIADVIKDYKNRDLIGIVRQKVQDLCDVFPYY